ncbi:MAG TPA: DinB family protein [Dehalococcoidia bacterium]|nr:DinB family protein [Dehalococcoidia bacterium]
MNEVDRLLAWHGWSHEADASGAAEPTAVDRLLEGLTTEQLRARPAPGLNSIVWILWHAARIEDTVINTIVAGTPQVLESAGWAERLGAAGVAIGTGMDDAEVEALSSRLEPESLRAYRLAVGSRTREIVRAVPVERWDELVDSERVRRAAAGASPGAGAWLGDDWLGRPISFFFAMPATAHSYVHLGEAWCLRALLGAGGGR